MGFDRPWYVQYASFVAKAVQGDFGESFIRHKPAYEVIVERLPATIQLAAFAFVLDPSGVGLLLKGNWVDIAHVTITAALGIAALACGVQGWMLTRASRLESLARAFFSMAA